MDVVRKKKRSRIFIAAAVLIITAITVTAVAGLLRKDDNREENNQNSVIKYFTPREIEFPEKLLSVENGYVVGDKFYLVCFYDDDKKTVFTIKDISAGTETIVNTDIEINYAVKSAVSEKCIYIADREKNNNNTYLKAFDINTGALLNEKSLGAVTVTGINTDTENNIIDLFTEGYQNDGLPHTIHMKINADSLETESSSDLTEYIDSSLSVNHSVIKGQKGFLIASEKVVTGEIKGIYSFDNEDNFLFSSDDFADNSLPKAAVMMPDGNISLITSENDYDFEIEELNMSSGEFADYFRLKSDEKVIAFKSVNLEKYDLIYETENGYYGFTADTESSELIKETGKSGNTLTSSSDGKLLFLGQNYNPGNYVQLMDENGQFSENKYRLFFDDEIKNWRRTNNWVADDGTFYCIAADYNDESKVSYLVSTDTQGITEKKKIEVPDKYQGIQNTAMTLAYANGSFYTVVIYEGSNRVCEISPDGKILSVSGEDDKVDYIDNIISTTDGIIIVGYFEKGKSAVSDIMDMAYFEPGDKISENKVSLSAATRIYNGFGKYRYLYANHDGIYGYTAANESEEIINWLDSDVTDGTLNTIITIITDMFDIKLNIITSLTMR